MWEAARSADHMGAISRGRLRKLRSAGVEICGEGLQDVPLGVDASVLALVGGRRRPAAGAMGMRALPSEAA